MVIQHNMSAMNASRQLGLVTGSLAKSTEKLSSGYKINRAADDAAGLSISEKMRKQIRGLDQASENIEDGISLCQVADGALNETVDILQRMRELAVQSANGTNSTSDRQFIEMEITQLKSEIDRIAVTTSFNDAVYPLNATINTYSDSRIVEIETPNVSGALTEYDPNDGLLREKTVTFKTNVACTYEGKKYNVGDTITITGLTTNDKEIWAFQGAAHTSDNSASWFGGHGHDYNNMKALKKSDLQIDDNGYLYFLNASNIKMYAVYVYNTTTSDPLHFQDLLGALSSHINPGTGRLMTVDDLGAKIPVTQPVVTQKPISTQVTYCSFNSNDAASIHSGASASQTNKIPVHIVNATCRGLGITDLTLATEDSSTGALNLLNGAIAKASSYRSRFGATQNRLEHAQKIDDNTSENTQAAESQIRDTDMAAEMVRYANTNILTQAGQSMLAQANQSRQGVLSLVA